MSNRLKVKLVEQMLEHIVSSSKEVCKQVNDNETAKFVMNVVPGFTKDVRIIVKVPVINLEANELREILYKRFEEEK